MPAIFPRVCETLLVLGVSPNYAGFYPTAYAVSLCTDQQEWLRLITIRLYPQVAKHYKMSWKSFERNLRTVVSVVWERNPSLLQAFAHRQLSYKPSNAEFLAILSLHFRPDATADDFLNTTAILAKSNSNS